MKEGRRVSEGSVFEGRGKKRGRGRGEGGASGFPLMGKWPGNFSKGGQRRR